MVTRESGVKPRISPCRIWSLRIAFPAARPASIGAKLMPFQRERLCCAGPASPGALISRTWGITRGGMAGVSAGAAPMPLMLGSRGPGGVFLCPGPAGSG